MPKSKRVQVSFTEKQWKMIEMLRGEMGDNDANIVRNIVLAWLAEKSFVSDTTKRKMNQTL
ncbi:MAG: CopG family transcriptional regulator [Promethearchaeota archaeon]